MTKTTQKSKIQKPVFGADPEYFAGYKNGDGDLCALPPVIFRTELGVPFTPHGTHPIFKKYGDTIVHEDGAAFEMSTSPSSDWKVLWENLNNAKTLFAEEVLSQFPHDCVPELMSIPTIAWDIERWRGRGDDFDMAVRFGCDPDQDVYGTEVKDVIMDASEHPYRYGGGHIHVSGVDMIESHPLLAVRCMVLTAGLAATAYSDVPELESLRLFRYGKPGKFRVQHYPDGKVGIEYRTVSTSWTKSKALAQEIFTWATIGIQNLLQGGLLEEIASKFETEAAEAILACDQAKSRQILEFIEEKI